MAPEQRCGRSVVRVAHFSRSRTGILALFCQIGLFRTFEAFASVEQDGRTFDLTKEVALVSIENGLHRTIGFHIDTAISARGNGEIKTIPLTDIFIR